MDLIDLTEFDDRFTIKLVGPPGLIAVNTLIETLAGFSQSLEAIGDAVDPQHELEVFVDYVAPGSINIGVRLKQHLKKNAKAYTLAAGVTSQVIVGIFSSYLYDQIKPQQECEVDDGSDIVIVKGDNCNVKVRRQVYDLKPRIENNPKVAQGVDRALQAVDRDPAVQSLGIGTSSEAKPVVSVSRSQFVEVEHRLRRQRELFDQRRFSALEAPAPIKVTRTLSNRAHLTVVKAVLLRSRRKWQFIWQGIKVSARITDTRFFDQLEARSIALRQGDALDAELEITQRLLSEANAWKNQEYVVTKVYSVRVGETQATMDFTSPSSAGASVGVGPETGNSGSGNPPQLGD
jgi:hypothetical protein